MRKIRKRVFAVVLMAALLFAMPGMASATEVEDAQIEEISEGVIVQAEEDATEELDDTAITEPEEDDISTDELKTETGDTEDTTEEEPADLSSCDGEGQENVSEKDAEYDDVDLSRREEEKTENSSEETTEDTEHTEDNEPEVRAQLEEILALYRELTEEEQEQVDLMRCYELQEALDAVDVPIPIVEDTPEIELFGQKVCSGDSGDGWSYADGVLTLNNYHADDSSKPFIRFINTDLNFTLKLTGDNSIKTSAVLFYGHLPAGSTTITGESGASLSLDGKNWNDTHVIFRDINVDVTTQGMIFLSYDMMIDNATVNFDMNGSNGYIYTTYSGLTVQNGSKVTIANSSGEVSYCVATNGIEIADSTLNITNPSGFGVYVTEISSNVPEHKAIITNSAITADVGIAGIHCDDEAVITNSEVSSSGQFAIRSKDAVTVDSGSTVSGIVLSHFNSVAGQPAVYQVCGQSTLNVNLTVAENESFLIQNGAALTIPAGVTLTNNGTMCIHDQTSLSGNGILTGGGSFFMDVTEDLISVPEELAYTGADYADQIKLEGNVTIYGVEFTADTTGWTRSISPNGQVVEAGEYTVTYTNGDKSFSKTFTVAECPHTGLVYKPQADNKHGGTCPLCNMQVSEEHTWVDGVCSVCRAKAVAVVEIGGNITYYRTFSDAWTAACYAQSAEIMLLDDVKEQTFLPVSSGTNITLNGGNHTLSINAIEVSGGRLNLAGGTFELRDLLRVSGGIVRISGGTVIKGQPYGIHCIGESADIKISGGTITGSENAVFFDVNIADKRAVSDLLENYGGTTGTYYAFYQNGKPIDLTNLENSSRLSGTVMVAECKHEGVKATPNNNGTHSLKCPYCGYTEAAANCDYGNEYQHDDTNHWQTCTVCGYQKTEAHTLNFEQGDTVNGVTTNYERCDCGFFKAFTVTVTVPSGLTYGNTGGKRVTYTVNPVKSGDTEWDLIDMKGNPLKMEGATLPVNLPAGDYRLWIYGRNNGKGAFAGTTIFTVAPAPLNGNMVTLSLERATYNGTEQKPTITVKQGETTLTEGTDYDVTYSTTDFTNAGTVIVTITGKGNYTGTVETTYTIKKAPLTITASDQTITYGGSITQGTDNVTAAGLCSGDNLDGITLTASTANVPGGNITPSAASIKNSGGKDVTGNYEITYKAGRLTINKADAEIMVGTNTYNKTFGDAAFTLDVTDNNIEADVQYEVTAGADVVSVSSGTVTIKNAGTATITVALPASTNYNAAESRTITINVAQKGGYTVTELNRSYLYSRENTGSIDLAALLPKDCGAVTYGTPATSGDVTYSAAPAVNDGKLSYTLNSGNINDEGTITVPVATRNYTDITITVKVKLTDRIPVRLKTGTEVTLKDHVLTYGEPLSKMVFHEAEFVGDDGNTVAGTLAWKDAAVTPDAGTTSAVWVFAPTDIAYMSVEGVVAIMVNRAVPTISEAPAVADRIYNPSIPLKDDDLSGATVTGVDGNTLEGKWNWQNANIIPTVNNSGYAAVFTPTDTTNYKTVTRTVTVNVTKATPYIAGLPVAAGITYGDTLDVSALSGGTVLHGDGAGQAGNGAGSTEAVAGAFTWKEPSAKPVAADSNATEYTIVFTPSDTANYNSAEAKVRLTVNKAQNAPNMPASTMSVLNSIGKVGSVPLPEGWEWQASDKDIALEVGVPTEAVAVYTGADKGNYENETVTVAITRSSCDHVPGDVLYTGEGEKEPTCTEDGLGHKECTKCGVVVESGIVVKAGGHDYKSEVTKKATTESEGIRTYTCTRCGHSYTRPIAKLPGDTKPGSGQSGDTKSGSSQPGDTESGGSQLGDTKPGSSQSKDTKPGSGNTEETRLEPGVPFIKGEDGKNGWDVIREEEEKAEEGSVIDVDMNGTTVVPGDIFDSIKGRDITITFDMGNGIIWSVDGRSITTDKVGDIDFSVKTGGNAIPVDVVNNVTGESYSIQISLAYDGEFGFTALLSINLGKENAGYTASLYYYNENTEELAFICADTVAEDGTASLAFTHASDYVIVIDHKEEEGVGTVTESAEPEGQDEDHTEETEESSQTGQPGGPWWIVVIGILAVVAGAGVFFTLRKKRDAD